MRVKKISKNYCQTNLGGVISSDQKEVSSLSIPRPLTKSPTIQPKMDKAPNQ